MEEKIDYASRLKEDYARWDTIWRQGWSDPNYPDGEGLCGARGRIIFAKKELEKAGEELPEGCNRPLPPDVPRDYMARCRELWYKGIQTYQMYLKNDDYQYLCRVVESLPREVRKQSSVDNVLGYAEGLRYALKHKTFLTLRRHVHSERYLESFRECRQRINGMMAKETLNQNKPEEGQMDLFQMGMRQPEKRLR